MGRYTSLPDDTRRAFVRRVKNYRDAVLGVPLRNGCARSLWWRLNADCTLHCRSAARFLRDLDRQVACVEVLNDGDLSRVKELLQGRTIQGVPREQLGSALKRAQEKKIWRRTLSFMHGYPAKTLMLCCTGLFRALARPGKISMSEYLNFCLPHILSASLEPPRGRPTRRPWQPKAVEQLLRRAGGVRQADEGAVALLSTEESLRDFRPPHELYRTERGLLWLEVHSSRGLWLRSELRSPASMPPVWRGKLVARPKLVCRLQPPEAEACLREIGRRFRITWPYVSEWRLNPASWEPPLVPLPEPVRALLERVRLLHRTA